MLALITGASSGIGRDLARALSKNGYDLILVSRSLDKLGKLKKELSTNVETYSYDLSIEKEVYSLYEKVKNKNIDLLINNAGFGLCGYFEKTDLDTELNMIDLNVKAYHILTKLFLQDMIRKDKGQILNVASSAAFEPGPLLATYYGTKSYIYNLTMSIYEELRRSKSNVKINLLCPGPVDTNFNSRANVKFNISSLSSEFVASYTVKMLKKNKLIIIPGLTIKLGVFATRLLSRKLLCKIMFNVQERKIVNKKSRL